MEDAREYLLRIPSFAAKKHSLSEAGAFFQELGGTFPGRVIHVAGTNGKGSVCAFLASILQASGLHVGTFTSPHLTDIRERFRLDGELIEEKAFQKGFEQVFQVWKRLGEQGMDHPTFFEYLFYMAAVWFQEVKPDAVILEAGMGGRRDVTSLCRPDLSVITSVSLDHMAYLGNTVEEIAAEKAGIIRPGVPLVFDGNDSRAAAVIREAAERAEAPAWDVREGNLQVSWKGEFPRISCPFGEERAEAVLPFPAEYQVWNAALAIKAAELLRDGRENGVRCGFREKAGQSGSREETGGFGAITAAFVSSGLAAARHGGRKEGVQPDVYFVGAHKRDGIRVFAQAAARIAADRGKPVRLLFSAVSDKEYGIMAGELVRDLRPAGIALVRMENGRGLSLEEMEKAFAGAGCPVQEYDSAAEALACALREKGEDLLFAAGSLYFIGELKKCLEEEGYDKF